MRCRVLLLSAAAAFAAIASAWSQTAGAIFPPAGTDPMSWPLGGLRQFVILVESLKPAAEHCGINGGDLRASLRAALGQSRLEILDGSPSPAPAAADASVIYLNVQVLDDCTSDVTLQVLTRAVLDSTHRHMRAATVWEAAYLRTGGEPGQDTREIVGQAAKALVDDWNAANPQ